VEVTQPTTTVEPALVGAGPDDQLVVATAREIAKEQLGHEIIVHKGSGRIIFQRFYDSSWDKWHQRNTGDIALEKLADELRKLRLNWNETKLYRAVRLFEQSENLDGLKPWPDLKLTHYHSVQGLPWDRQRALLDEAQKSSLSTDELRELAHGERKRTKAGIPQPERDAGRLLKALERALGKSEELNGRLRAAEVSAGNLSAFERASASLQDAIDALQLELTSPKPAEEQAPAEPRPILK